MNEKNLKAILEGAGLPKTILEDIEKPDFDAKAVITAFNESQKVHYHDIIKNEISGEIEDELNKSISGKLLGTLNNDLKKITGVPLEKIKELSVSDKIKVAKAHLDELYAKNPSGDEMKKMQEQYLELQNKYADLEKNKETDIENVRREEKSKTAKRITDLDFTKNYQSIPAEKLAGKKHSDGIRLALNAYISSKYDLGIDEKEETVIYEKGSQKRATAKDASGKEYFVGLPDLMLSSLKELNFLNESNGGEGSGNAGKGGGSGNGQQQKSQRMIELEEAAAKASAA